MPDELIAEPADEVVVASFRSSDEVRLAIDALQGAGIAARPAADYARWIAARDATPMVGTGVLVAAADAEAARAMLETIWPPAPRARASDPEIERCPACGAASSFAFPRLRVFVVAALVTIALGFVTDEMRLFMLTLGAIAAALLITPNRRCTSCGERWRGKRPPQVVEEGVEPPDVPCPRCGSTETFRIDRRRLRAVTLIVNLVVPPFFVFWPLLPKRRCERCDHEWH